MNKLLLGLLAFALVSQSCINAAPTIPEAPATTPTAVTLEPTDLPTGPTAVTLEPTDQPKTPTAVTLEPTDAPTGPTAVTLEPTDAPTGPTAVTLEPTDPATEKVETTTQKAYDCSKGDGMYPSPYDCADFYVCFSSEVLTFTCPDKLWYDSKLKSCNWPNLVDCDIN